MSDHDESTGDTDHCPECGKAVKSTNVFPPNQGSNRTDKTVTRHFHIDDMEYCERSAEPDTDRRGDL